MFNTFLGTITALTILFSAQPVVVKANKPLAQVNYSLSNRYGNTYVNDVFKENILLTTKYTGNFSLKPGQSFAFHDAVLEKYKNKVVVTTNSHFNSSEGFKSDGYLVGDGVCHLASFMYVAAKNAGLEVEAPTPHDFAVIPDVQKKDGVSIFSESASQNLYITNNKDEEIRFVFTNKNDILTIRVETANMNK